MAGFTQQSVVVTVSSCCFRKGPCCLPSYFSSLHIHILSSTFPTRYSFFSLLSFIYGSPYISSSLKPSWTALSPGDFLPPQNPSSHPLLLSSGNATYQEDVCGLISFKHKSLLSVQPEVSSHTCLLLCCLLGDQAAVNHLEWREVREPHKKEFYSCHWQFKLLWKK